MLCSAARRISTGVPDTPAHHFALSTPHLAPDFLISIIYLMFGRMRRHLFISCTVIIFMHDIVMLSSMQGLHIFTVIDEPGRSRKQQGQVSLPWRGSGLMAYAFWNKDGNGSGAA